MKSFLLAGLVLGASAIGDTADLKDVSVSDLGTKDWSREFTLEEFEAFSSDDLRSMFEKWMTDHSRVYDDNEEEAYRYLVWLDALQGIAHANSEDYLYKLRLNQFGDMTGDEFRLYVHGGQDSCLYKEGITLRELNNQPSRGDEGNPSSVDWREGGHVTPVKNQGSCGSCWAFSSTGSLECQYSINHGTLYELSEQQLVDCSRSYGNYGCNGGWWYNAFDYVKDEGGLCTESEYSYTAKDGTCKDSSCGKKYVPISGYTSVSSDSESSLESAVAKGCVSVGVEADQFSFQYYSSGILDSGCGTNIDHGVLAVGYGTDNGEGYWWVKNSWGTGWGDKGYIRICKNCGQNGSKGECGINMYDAYPNT